VFSADLREKAHELVDRYPVSRSALLPLLHLVQSQDGYLSDDGIAECAELLGLTKAEVMGVATFYTMYKREPMGRHLVSVCTNFSCKIRGAQDVYDRLHDKLGVGHNQTTEDGMFTFEHAECLGNCEGAPILSIDYYNYEAMTPDGAEDLLDKVAAGDVPPPTRGTPPPGIRLVEHRLAGVGPHPEDSDRGEVLGHARAFDGGVPPPIAADVGPQTEVEVVAADPGEDREQAVEREIERSGVPAEHVEEEAGGYAEEFPAANEPGARPGDPGSAEAPAGAETDASADDSGEGDDAGEGERSDHVGGDS
jgi:NADH-quinone oxidoreductase subunit E